MWRRALAVLVLGVACSGSTDVECRYSKSVASPLVGGATSSNYVHLAPKQEAALVGIYLSTEDAWCSGTLIAEGAVLTAGHCILWEEESREIQLVAGRTSVLVVAARAVRHPDLDAALLLFDEPPLTGVARPIRLGAQDVVAGQLLQVAGHGFDENGDIGLLNFAVEPVTGMDDVTFTVGTDGASGLCAGDSGAGALTRGPDGAVVVVGLMNSGSISCRGTDRYLKAPRIMDWVRDTLGGSDVDGGGGDEPVFCGEVGAPGRCFGRSAVWCDGGAVVAEDCVGDTRCGWSAGRGFRCVAPTADPCAGYSDMGDCVADTVVSCRGGALVESPCDVCGATCARDPRSGEAGCWTAPQ